MAMRKNWKFDHLQVVAYGFIASKINVSCLTKLKPSIVFQLERHSQGPILKVASVAVQSSTARVLHLQEVSNESALICWRLSRRNS